MATPAAGLLQGKAGKSPQELGEDTQVMSEDDADLGKGGGKTRLLLVCQGGEAKAKALVRVGSDNKGGKPKAKAKQTARALVPVGIQHSFLDQARADQLYVIYLAQPTFVGTYTYRQIHTTVRFQSCLVEVVF